MKFGVMFANVGPFGQAEGLTHLARTAESVGTSVRQRTTMPSGVARCRYGPRTTVCAKAADDARIRKAPTATPAAQRTDRLPTAPPSATPPSYRTRGVFWHELRTNASERRSAKMDTQDGLSERAPGEGGLASTPCAAPPSPPGCCCRR